MLPFPHETTASEFVNAWTKIGRIIQMTNIQSRTKCPSAGRRRAALLSVLALGFVGLPPAAAQAERSGLAQAAAARATYDQTVLADKPSAYWAMASPRSGTEKDQTPNGHTGTYFGRPAPTKLPNGDTAADFDGKTEYLQVKDAAALSPATHGVLTLEAWMRPDALKFPVEGTNKRYMHWMGKGEPNNQEYVARFYSNTDSKRPNRISGYQFNIDGGKGAGSYFQDKIHPRTWIHYVLVINAKKSGAYPHGYTKIYKNGDLRQQEHLVYRGTVIVPKRGHAPFRVATRDLSTFFEGAIGKVAIYTKELSEKRIKTHYSVMTRK
jgi:hypothetical protein